MKEKAGNLPEEDLSANMEKAVENLPEVEDLSDVDIGLPEDDMLNLAARERAQLATDYGQLNIRLRNARMSLSANEAVANGEGIKKFKAQADDLASIVMHCLRGIKEIDKMFPEVRAEGKDRKLIRASAKARMLEMLARGKQRQETS